MLGMKPHYFVLANMKTQSAMEYLMTYGWAILIIAIVLGILYYLGIFNSGNFAPRAQPGSCQVFRPNGPESSYDVGLSGTCNGEMPEYVAEFNGGRIQLPQMPITIGSVTITAWVYFPPGISPNYYDFIGFHNAAGYGFEDLILPGPPPEFGTRFDTPTYSNYYAYGSSSLSSTGDWVFYVAVLYSGTAAEGYTDLQPGSGNSATLPYYLTANQNYIGSPGPNLHYAGNPPDGIMISNVQLYNASLSANDIRTLYLEGIGGAPIKLQNLLGWWPLNGNTNDYSGNSNNGAANGVFYTSQWTNEYTAP